MIVFNNFQISVQGLLIGYQYDNLTRSITVVGTIPPGWDWAAIVQSGSNLDIIPLSVTESGLSATLTADNLSIPGYYKIQLRATQGELVQHTNIVQAYIGPSLSGSAQWPTVPTEFTQVEQNILTLNSNPPYPGDNGYWMVYDLDTGGYVQSTIPLPEVSAGPPGPDGKAATVQVGNTTTGEPGTAAAVVNTGTENAAILNFIIPRGANGIPGEPGPQGNDGADGFSPTATVQQTDTGAVITITDKTGTTQATITNGTDGSNGSDGAPGTDGNDGADGGFYTPGVTQPSADTMEVTFTPSAPGMPTLSPVQVTLPAGPQGEPGPQGNPGNDGVSPTATVEQTETGAVVTVTDASGATTATLTNGSPGPAGADGGYYTPSVSQPTPDTMQVAFTPSASGMPTVGPTDITLPSGGGGEVLNLTGFQPDPSDPNIFSAQLTDEQYNSVVSCQVNGTPIYIENTFLVYPTSNNYYESPHFSSVPFDNGTFYYLIVNSQTKMTLFYGEIPLSATPKNAGAFYSLNTPQQNNDTPYQLAFETNVPVIALYPASGGNQLMLYPDIQTTSTGTYVFSNSQYTLTFDTQANTATLSQIDRVTETQMTEAINAAIGGALEASY